MRLDRRLPELYSALVYQGGSAWRERLSHDLGGNRPLRAMLEEYDDDALHTLMTNLAGHDLESVLEAFHAVNDDTPTCFIAYTIIGICLALRRPQRQLLGAAEGRADGGIAPFLWYRGGRGVGSVRWRRRAAGQSCSDSSKRPRSPNRNSVVIAQQRSPCPKTSRSYGRSERRRRRPLCTC